MPGGPLGALLAHGLPDGRRQPRAAGAHGGAGAGLVRGGAPDPDGERADAPGGGRRGSARGAGALEAAAGALLLAHGVAAQPRLQGRRLAAHRLQVQGAAGLARAGRAHHGLRERGQGQREVPVHAGALLRAALQGPARRDGGGAARTHERRPHDQLLLALLQHARADDCALGEGDQSDDHGLSQLHHAGRPCQGECIPL